MSEPTVIPPGRTVNVARGLGHLCESLVRCIPHGDRLLNLGLSDVIHEGLRTNPSIPQGEMTVPELARKLGILPALPEPPRISGDGGVPRRRRRRA